MKPWIKRTLIGVFGASVLFGGLAACSRRMHGPWAGPMTEAQQAEWRGRMVERASRKLDLDAAQKAKLNVLADTLSTQRQAVRSSGGEARAEMKVVLAGAQFDRSRAQALFDAKANAVRAAAPAVINATADFFDSLKPEQQEKLRGYLARGGHHGWRS